MWQVHALATSDVLEDPADERTQGKPESIFERLLQTFVYDAEQQMRSLNRLRRVVLLLVRYRARRVHHSARAKSGDGDACNHANHPDFLLKHESAH